MSEKREALTAADLRTLRAALNHAMDERDSLADAYGRKGPQAKAALAAVKAFEDLHVKIFGFKSSRQEDIERFAALPTISLTDLALRSLAEAPSMTQPTPISEE